MGEIEWFGFQNVSRHRHRARSPRVESSFDNFQAGQAGARASGRKYLNPSWRPPETAWVTRVIVPPPDVSIFLDVSARPGSPRLLLYLHSFCRTFIPPNSWKLAFRIPFFIIAAFREKFSINTRNVFEKYSFSKIDQPPFLNVKNSPFSIIDRIPKIISLKIFTKMFQKLLIFAFFKTPLNNSENF